MARTTAKKKAHRSTTRSTKSPFEKAARVVLADAARSMRTLERSRAAAAVGAAAELAVASMESGGSIYFCGNGGSAADAQHFAAELSGRYLVNRPALPAVALSTNTSALTAIGNDYGYKYVFSRQLEGVAMPGDVLVAITTSGTSTNVLEAVKIANRLGMAVVGMTGSKGRKFAAACDIALVTPSASTPRIQEGHVVMGHAFCELIERAMFGAGTKKVAARSRRG